MAVQAMAENKKTTGYAPINGLNMYYEIEGQGKPLVYIHPAFGFTGLKSLPELFDSHQVICMDLQGHGRTADLADRPLSIEQHAKDIVALLKYLNISKANFFGESYGGAIATMIAVRNPELVDRVASYGGTFGPSKDALNFEMLKDVSTQTADSQSLSFQREGYKKVAPIPTDWSQLWAKATAMKWEGFSDEELSSIKAPLLILLGDHDFVRLDHAVDTFKKIPNAELAVIPDAGHFLLFSEPERAIPVVKYFLEKPAKREPIGTGGTGYQPERTR